MHLTRRKAKEADVPFLLRLRRESMDEHLQAAGESTSETEHHARLKYRFECAEVLLQDGNPIGLLKISRDAGSWKVLQVQLLPEFQGQGLGGKLLRQVIGEAVAEGVPLTLSVLKANPARSLYERLGFVVESESDSEYNMRCGLAIPAPMK